jgi:LPXTG-site transpeptidase (sortase) family protein
MPKAEPVITYSTNEPDESKENADNYNWRGSPDEPKKIRITKINVDAYVQKAGVDQNKQVAVPNNVHLAGWFADSQKPGQNGLSIVAGHVTGRTTDGVFKELGKLKSGDEFEIELGSGEIKRYKVIENQQVKESESASILFSQNPKVKSQINLITCGGNFNNQTDQYEDRVIVSGELQS